MGEIKKTKQELLKEIAALKKKLAAAEKMGGVRDGKARRAIRRLPRRPINADIEFIGDFDILKAQGVNISRGGICLKMQKNMPFEMKMYQGSKLKSYRAELVWLKQSPNGEYHIGFKFIDDKALPEF
ncbi:MAG: PilZ domain-containing protein [Desulfobacterota bacterium]|nr:PilZ domain-containing protein [Thermodesulfobacteriota bacterium]